jgi:hypothetical protein
VSTILVKAQQTDHQKKQLPIYYVSGTLEGPKKHYTQLEKVAYTVLMASRKLKHYFQSHEITIPSSYPLDNIFKNPEAIGRIGKWATKLNDHVINFVANWTLDTHGQTGTKDPIQIVHVDGAWGASGAG